MELRRAVYYEKDLAAITCWIEIDNTWYIGVEVKPNSERGAVNMKNERVDIPVYMKNAKADILGHMKK